MTGIDLDPDQIKRVKNNNIVDESLKFLKADAIRLPFEDINGRLSYVSRPFSRIAGDNSMTDEELREYLEAKNRFRLIKSRIGHFVFEKKIRKLIAVRG